MSPRPGNRFTMQTPKKNHLLCMIGLLKAIKTLVSCHRPKTLYERRLGPCSPEPTSCRSLGTLAPKLQEFKVGRIGQKAWIGLKGPPWHRHLGLLLLDLLGCRTGSCLAAMPLQSFCVNDSDQSRTAGTACSCPLHSDTQAVTRTAVRKVQPQSNKRPGLLMPVARDHLKLHQLA